MKGVGIQPGVMEVVGEFIQSVRTDEPLDVGDDCLGVTATQTEEITDTVLATPLRQDFFQCEIQRHEGSQSVEVELLTVQMDMDGSPIGVVELRLGFPECRPELVECLRNLREHHGIIEDILAVLLTSERMVLLV
jgi:hypothetical protein